MMFSVNPTEVMPAGMTTVALASSASVTSSEDRLTVVSVPRAKDRVTVPEMLPADSAAVAGRLTCTDGEEITSKLLDKLEMPPSAAWS